MVPLSIRSKEFYGCESWVVCAFWAVARRVAYVCMYVGHALKKGSLDSTPPPKKFKKIKKIPQSWEPIEGNAATWLEELLPSQLGNTYCPVVSVDFNKDDLLKILSGMVW